MIRSLNKKQLIIVPDGIFNYISFEALVTNETNLETPSYLLYDANIETLASAQLLPYVDFDSEAIPNAKVALFSFSDKKSLKTRSSKLKELPWALTECKALSQSFNNVVSYYGKKATVNNFLNCLEKDFDLVHVATHGVSSSTSLYDVKLYFRNKDYSLDSLFGYELLDQEIKAKKIMLTACEVGSSAQSYAENNFDIKKYLYLQGAKKVQAAIWPLNDQATAEIIKYYSETNHNSLQKAKIEFLSNYPDYQQPFFWAGLN